MGLVVAARAAVVMVVAVACWAVAEAEATVMAVAETVATELNTVGAGVESTEAVKAPSRKSSSPQS